MPAFHYEHDRRRLTEAGLSWKKKVRSQKIQLWSLLAERTEAPNSFELQVKTQGVTTAVGFEQRGDLMNSYNRSVQEAETDAIARRYQLENDGYEKAKDLFSSLPLYSTVVLASPPPEIPIPGYGKESMMYFYHVLPSDREDERTIKALTWMNRLSTEEQAEIINNIGETKNVQPTTQSLLLNPQANSSFFQDARSFREMWDKVEEVYKRKERDFMCLPGDIMEMYLLHGDKLREKGNSELAVMIDEIAKRMARGENAEDLETRWAIMLNLADLRGIHTDITSSRLPSYDVRIPVQSAGVIFDKYRHLAYEPEQKELPCGPSSSLTGRAAQTPVTTWTFAVQTNKNVLSAETEKTLKCTCPFCKKRVVAFIKNGRIYCPRTEECGKSAPYNC